MPERVGRITIVIDERGLRFNVEGDLLPAELNVGVDLVKAWLIEKLQGSAKPQFIPEDLQARLRRMQHA